jgi:E3 ubiquitin-protein ligase DMA1/2
MLEGKNSTYPHFQCPNCRAWTDLSAEVDVAEEDLEEWMENAGDSEDPGRTSDNAASAPGANLRSEEDTAHIGTATNPENNMPDADQDTGRVDESAVEPNGNQSASLGALLARRQAAQPASEEIASVNGLEMPNQLTPSITNTTEVDRLGAATPEAGEVLSGEGPLTPRNNAGPFVFDGSGGRSSGRRAMPANGEVSE